MAHWFEDEAPLLENRPLLQFEQASEPVADAYFPAEQSEQELEPLLGAYVPAEQSEQLAVPGAAE